MWLVCFGGRVKKLHTLTGTSVHFLRCASHTHICACTCIVYSRPKRSIFRSSLPANGTTAPVSPPGLSCPAVHSAERDICSVGECPNYSWSFNHSGFGLCGICGASHKRVTATLVNGCFISVLYYIKYIYISTNNLYFHFFMCYLMNECKNDVAIFYFFLLPAQDRMSFLIFISSIWPHHNKNLVTTVAGET